MLREFYMLYLHIVSWTQYTYKMPVFLNKKPYHFMAALPFSLVFKTEDQIGYRVRFTHLGIALTIRSDILLIETVLELENKKLYTYQLCPSTGKKEWVVRRSSGPTSCFCATSYYTDCCYYSPLGSRDLCQDGGSQGTRAGPREVGDSSCQCYTSCRTAGDYFPRVGAPARAGGSW